VKLKPFFCFFGGKYRIAPRYPPPTYPKVVEPFAGAAGYSTRHHSADVRLSDKDPVIVGVWRYLISTTAAEIARIPLLGYDQGVEDLTGWPQEAKHLVGFWLNKGTARPCKRPSSWMRQGYKGSSFWGEEIRTRISSQVEHIRHWRIQEGSYEHAPNFCATWFVDPPYARAGKDYRCSARDIDFEHLSAWCRDRLGQVLVCENAGADWLPFTPFLDAKAMTGKYRTSVTKEVLYQRG
jgi:hypothetical protein